jgi:putative two-component system response regulator
MVLLVDNADSDRTTWKSFLENQNYEVITAADGPAALRQCLLLQPDLVLLHDAPPELDGFELCRRFKESPFNELIPIVLIRDSSEPADISRGREAGAAEVWRTCASLEEGLCRMQELLRLNNYINEQAKSVVLSLARSMEAKNSLSEGHSERMVEYAVQLAESIGMQQQELQEMEMACRLHDIGKVAIPDSILLKPGPLDIEEMEIVRRHPMIGEKICAPLKSLRGILPVIRHHHERMDGSGYPDGLSGEQIPVKARILQVADIYDALTTHRPYRVALSSPQALQILNQEAARGWLDASLVREFYETRGTEAPLRLNRRSMLASYYGVWDSTGEVAFASRLTSPLHRASAFASGGRRVL